MVLFQTTKGSRYVYFQNRERLPFSKEAEKVKNELASKQFGLIKEDDLGLAVIASYEGNGIRFNLVIDDIEEDIHVALETFEDISVFQSLFEFSQ